MPSVQIYVYAYLPDDHRATPAGVLEMNEDGRESYATFRYGRQYLTNPKRIPVDAVTLPLHSSEDTVTYRTEDGFKIFGGIRDASPDGWGRHLLEREQNRLELAESEYLLLAGEQRVGALAFGRDLKGPLTREKEIDGAAIRLEELLLDAEKVDGDVGALREGHQRFFLRGSSLGGARPKAVTVWRDEWWLAKFARKEDRYDIVRSEYAVMTLARKCGLNVPAVELVRVLERDIFLIRRFDRQGPAREGAYVRRHFNSALSMLNAHESESSRKSYEEIAEVIRRLSSDARADGRELFRRMVFNILVNNNDDHLRNHGFLLNGNHWDLSPLYDVVPNVQVGRERDLAIGVGTQGRSATLENALSRCTAFYFSREQAQAEIDGLRAIVRGWKEHFIQAGFSADQAEGFRNCFAAAEA